MTRRVIAVSIAIVLAVVGAVLVLVYAKNADARAIAQASPTKVYLAQKLIPSGTTLKDAQRTELIVETQVAAKAVPVGALATIDADNNALLALSDVQPGEILIASRFGTTPVGAKAIEVPSGMVAISVQLEDPARVGRFVTPGSHIAVYQTYKKVKFGTDEATEQYNSFGFKGTSVLLDDVLVIGMGETPLNAPKQAEGEATKAAAPSFLVTVAVTPQNSVRLVHAINGYTLYAGLRGSDVKFPPSFEAADDTNAIPVPTPRQP